MPPEGYIPYSLCGPAGCPATLDPWLWYCVDEDECTGGFGGSLDHTPSTLNKKKLNPKP